MSWLQNLYLTYEKCKGIDDKLLPLFHMYQNTHIEVILDENGKYLNAKREDLKNTLIPCTEKSQGARTNDPPPHPLCDKLVFVAKDYSDYFEGKSYFDKYIDLLGKWSESVYSNYFIKAVYTYLQKGTLLTDLLNKQAIKQEEMIDSKKIGDLFVRWVVEVPGLLESKSWKNKELIESWQNFCINSGNPIKNVCYVLGVDTKIAINHPKRIRNSGDGGKLISTNDTTGFTFRGRFDVETITIEGKKQDIALQPVTVSVEVSQKAHRALSWLIDRQGFKNDTQVIISWSISSDPDVPCPVEDTWKFFDLSNKQKIEESNSYNYFDAGQTFAKNLNNRIRGYSVKLGPTNKIVVMGLDSVVPGRIAISYYRELTGSEFLERIESWHWQMAWQYHLFLEDETNKKKKISANLVKAPSLVEIAEACYGTKRDEDFNKFKKRVIERILPCVIDGTSLPFDLVTLVFNRAVNPLAYPPEKHWQWENALSIACSLYKCYSVRNLNPKIEYDMALENERNDRDYLYGRLLAVAEYIEQIALNVAGENRETTAARLMQRFADRPYSTWRTIELALRPYIARLHVNRPGFMNNMQKLLDEIHCKFIENEYENDNRLSGAFLLGYHCQRLEFRHKKESDSETEINQP